jgi:hypothetical protein
MTFEAWKRSFRTLAKVPAVSLADCWRTEETSPPPGFIMKGWNCFSASGENKNVPEKRYINIYVKVIHMIITACKELKNLLGHAKELILRIITCQFTNIAVMPVIYNSIFARSSQTHLQTDALNVVGPSVS